MLALAPTLALALTLTLDPTLSRARYAAHLGINPNPIPDPNLCEDEHEQLHVWQLWRDLRLVRVRARA